MKNIKCPNCAEPMVHEDTVWSIMERTLATAKIYAFVLFKCEKCGAELRFKIVKEVKI